MRDNMITIPAEEYKRLLESAIRIEIFSKFVNENAYISKKECGSYLKFEVKENDGED